MLDNKPTDGFECYFYFTDEGTGAQSYRVSSVVDLGFEPKFACLPRSSSSLPCSKLLSLQSSFINDVSALPNKSSVSSKGRVTWSLFYRWEVTISLDLKSQWAEVSGCKLKGRTSTGIWISWSLMLCSSGIPEESLVQQVLLHQSHRAMSVQVSPICSWGRMG